MKKNIEKFLKRSERGQAIILITFAFIGLIAMVGLVTDTGILLIEYGKLKRSVDAAAIAAAQEYRPRAGNADLDVERLHNAAIGILHFNQIENIRNVEISTCEPISANNLARPALCNAIGGNPMANRKLVQVTASSDVTFGFMRVIGINSVTLTATSLGEAATIDLVLIMDTSASMAYETGNETYDPGNNINTNLSGYKPEYGDTDDDPSVCNDNNSCEPMRAVKNVAWDFVSHLYFPYDRVSIVTMTSQNPGEERYPIEVIPLTSDRGTIQSEIAGVTVFEPRNCETNPNVEPGEGSCLNYDGGGNFAGALCQIYERHSAELTADPSSCPSSNVGGVLDKARTALQGSGNINNMRVDSFWVVVALIGGPANATDGNGTYPNGFCPQNTWLFSLQQDPWCRDPYPSTRHDDTDPLINYTVDGNTLQISQYDAEDYARDKADDLANLVSGNGVTIYTIGLGAQIQTPAYHYVGGVRTNIPTNVEPPPGEYLLQYIAEEAGDPGVSHGQYFYASNTTALSGIFERIAQNIATKISQ